MKHEERNEQIVFIGWLNLVYPTVVTIISPVVKYGGTQKQRLVQGMIQKRLGYRKGTPDLFIPEPRKGFHGLFIEFKKVVGGTNSPEQKRMVEHLNQKGYLAKFCHGAEEAKKLAMEYLL